MLQWDKPVFEPPFELWRADGVLHLVLAKGAQVRVHDMKEFIRLVAALDRSGHAPVLMEYSAGVVVEEGARALLTRVCRAQGHPVALLATDPQGRKQAEVYKHVGRPSFPFRVFSSQMDAACWVRERCQLAELEQRY